MTIDPAFDDLDREFKAKLAFLRTVGNGKIVKIRADMPRQARFVGRVGRVTDYIAGFGTMTVVFANGEAAGTVLKSEIEEPTLAERKAFRAEKAEKDERRRVAQVERNVAAQIRSNAGRR